MRLIIIVIAVLFVGVNAHAQKTTDSIPVGTVVVLKDARIDLLGQKLAVHNETNSVVRYTNGLRAAKGYRLMVINTNDRALAMKLRGQLYQYFPDQKQYMSYQMPNTKIKMGNYVDRADAERARKQIVSMKLVSNNIYILSETVEVKEEKEKDEKSER